MRHHSRRNRKQSGFIVTVELLFIVTILVIGLVAGWIEVRNAVVAELSDVGEAVSSLDQGYYFPGTFDVGSTALTEGSDFVDQLDVTAGFSDTDPTFAGEAGATGMTVVLAPTAGEFSAAVDGSP